MEPHRRRIGGKGRQPNEILGRRPLYRGGEIVLEVWANAVILLNGRRGTK